MSSRFIPQADLWQVSKNSRVQRKLISKFMPAIGLRCINYGDLYQIDQFYLNCQSYRDAYRDAYNKLHAPQQFGQCLVKTDLQTKQLTAPVSWVREPQPVVYPEEYADRLHLDGAIHIAAVISRNSSNVYKR